jgi:hypothetical protein
MDLVSPQLEVPDSDAEPTLASVEFEAMCQRHQDDQRQLFSFYRTLITYVDPVRELLPAFEALGQPDLHAYIMWLRKKIVKERAMTTEERKAKEAAFVALLLEVSLKKNVRQTAKPRGHLRLLVEPFRAARVCLLPYSPTQGVDDLDDMGNVSAESLDSES